jgi:hypothetical protein
VQFDKIVRQWQSQAASFVFPSDMVVHLTEALYRLSDAAKVYREQVAAPHEAQEDENDTIRLQAGEILRSLRPDARGRRDEDRAAWRPGRDPGDWHAEPWGQ